MTASDPLAPVPAPSDTRRRPSRRGVLAGVVVALVVAVAAVVAVASDPEDPAPEAGGSRLMAAVAPVLIEPRDGAPPDLVAVVTQDERGPLQPWRSLVRAGFDGEVRWRRLIDAEAVPTVLAVERGVVLLQELSDPVAEALTLTEPSDLVALDSDDGSALWRTTVEAATPPWIVGDRVVVPGEDGALVALDLATGEEAWSLDDPANTSTAAPTVRELGDDAVLVSRSRADGGVELVPVALEDGVEGPAFVPACDDGTGGEERAFDASDVRRVPGTTDAVVVFGQLPQCVQRWDTTTGEPRWTAITVPLTDDFGDRAPSPRSLVLDEDHLAFDGADGTVVVDLDAGTHRVLPGSGEAPVLVGDGSVVTVAVDDDGAHPELDGWALDGTVPRWEDVHVGVEDAATLVVDGRGAIASDASVLAEPDDDVLRTISLDDPTGGEVGALDPETGEVTVAPLRLHPDRDERTAPTWTFDIVGDRAVVVVAGRPHLVDLATGEVVASWPIGQ